MATLALSVGSCEDGDDDTDLSDQADDDTDVSDQADDDTQPAGPCAAEMVLIESLDLRFCIDRWEAACDEVTGSGTTPWSPYEAVDGVQVQARAEQGAVPQGYISGDQASAACEQAGKRLCTSDEWLLACRGPDESVWPYGDEWAPGTCNDNYPGHPVVDYYGTADDWIWTYSAMNDPGINQQPDTLAAAGEHADCVSHYGVLDMVGNLHEWVADADGAFRGGFYGDVTINDPGCTYRTGAHAPSYHDYSTGFRCCGEPAD